MMQTKLCELLGIQYPIIMGGMAWAGDHKLAAAVSKAGGMGVLGSGNMSLDELEKEIVSFKELTDKPLGVNVFMKDELAPKKAEVATRMGTNALFTGIGIPDQVVRYAKDAGIPVIPTVAAVKHAVAAVKSGADMLVAEGMEGGGHIGECGTLPLVPQVRDQVGDDVPIIAAGGIGDGSQLVACLAMGAVGIMMGTRFLIADECISHDKFKQKLIDCSIEGTTVTGRFSGFPMRCMENDFTCQFHEMETVRPSAEVYAFGAGKMIAAILHGDVDQGSCPTGQVVGMIRKRESAKEIIESIIAQAEAITQTIIDANGFNGWQGGTPTVK